jgi:hypothetical protein
MSDRDNHPSRLRPIAVRALATIMAATLVFAALAPSFAWAEAESEGEGSSQPGSPIPGLEEGATFEPGGEETSLEEVPALEGEEEAEPPVGSELEPEPGAAPEAVVPPAVVEPGPSAAEPIPPIAEEPAPAPTSGPVYGTAEEAGPDYETTAPAAPAEAVRNEAIVAPPSSGTTPPPVRSDHKRAAPPQRAPAPEPAETPEPVAPSSTPAAVPAGQEGDLRGRPFHTVAAGECLWSIAEGVLPAGVTEAEIAAEVSRLWSLNAARIGTGDPSLILVGTVLRLH